MPDSRPRLSLWAKVAFWPLLLLSAALLMSNMAWVLSEAYSAHAWQLIRSKQYGKLPLKAAGLSAYLSPGNAVQHLNYAHMLASYQMPDRAHMEFSKALRISPADPGLWHAFVKFKLFVGEYDAELEHAVDRVYQLAPNDFGLHLGNSHLAMRHWKAVGQPIKERWAVSIEKVIGESTMVTFLELVLQNAQEELLCREPRFSQLDIGWWCYSALQARQICFASKLTHEQEDWCRKIGLTKDAQR